MKFMRALCWVSLGGLIGTRAHAWEGTWGVLLLVSACGWAWYALGQTARAALNRIQAVLLGRPQPLPTTDPRALAAEVAALNTQISQLRDTATSFDMSFDQTLQRLDERLRRLEQQSAYVQAGHRV